MALALAAACGDDDDEAQPAAAAAPAAEPEPAPAPAAAPEPAPAAEPEPAPAAEPEPVVLKTGTLRIGSAHPMTGDFAWAGETLSNGIRVATAMINEGDARCVAAGICEPGGGFVVGDTLYTIELVERDTRSDINAAVIATGRAGPGRRSEGDLRAVAARPGAGGAGDHSAGGGAAPDGAEHPSARRMGS